MTERYDVVIVGGAVAGATLANALGRAGVRTMLVEKLARERHGARGDVIHPPGLRALESLGLLDSLIADGALQMRWICLTDASGGLVAKYPMPAQGDGPASRTLAVPHDRIEAVLYDRAQRHPSVAVASGVVTDLVKEDSGRVRGVRYRPNDSGAEVELQARVVVGCDGTSSTVRRAAGIGYDDTPYKRNLVFLECDGTVEPEAALHYHVDQVGLACVVARPRNASRAFFTVEHGGLPVRGEDPALREYLLGRFPDFAPLTIERSRAYLYRLTNRLSHAFAAPGVALVGDAAHTTHPVGATGMSLAIAGVVEFAKAVLPVLTPSASDREIDDALRAYDAERRVAAEAALAATRAQATRMYESDLHLHPDEFARVIDPAAHWTARGAGYGQNPTGAARAS